MRVVRDVDVDYRALIDLHSSEGLEDAVFILCRDGHSASAGELPGSFIVASGLIGVFLK